MIFSSNHSESTEQRSMIGINLIDSVSVVDCNERKQGSTPYFEFQVDMK